MGTQSGLFGRVGTDLFQRAPAMKPVFANSAWIWAPEPLILRRGGWRRRRLRVRYGLVLHPTSGPTLIDTGYTPHSVTAKGRGRWLRIYGRTLSPRLIAQAQAETFLGTFGLSCQDISAVIITHFHADHISGLAAFPNARFIANRAAWNRIQSNGRFQNLKQGVFAELIPSDFENRLGPIEDCNILQFQSLPKGHDIFGDGTVAAIPLPGHADGHIGLLFPQLDTPLLYATDTQWVGDALPRSARPRLAPRLISDSYAFTGHSSDSVENFRNSGGQVLLCHDDAPSPFDFEDGAAP